MANATTQLAALLLDRKLVSAEQLDKARALQQATGVRLEDALVKLGDVTYAELARLIAEVSGLSFVDLREIYIPPAVIEFVPESVARENTVLPLAMTAGAVWMAIADPADLDCIQKLQFILNRDIHPVVALREQIVEAINWHYGQTETESVDSCLVELTDTQIDFAVPPTRGMTPAPAASAETLHDKEAEGDEDFDLALEEEAVTVTRTQPAATKCKARMPAKRQATVRYYERMNPERMFPLLVVLSREKIQEVVKRAVVQAQSQHFEVDTSAPVEVEPILPGCHCYPPKDQVAVGADTATVTFWVVPHVLGKIMQARVAVRQNGRLLAEVPLEMKVVKQTLTLLLGALSLVLPLLLMVMRHFRLDFESQLADGFGLYAQVGHWALASLSPEGLTAGLMLLAGLTYLWLRPRRRDVFWDIAPAAPAEKPAPERPAEPFAAAEALYRANDFAKALPLYESGLARGKAAPVIYHHAALTAYRVGRTAHALAILQEAEARLGPGAMPGALWYNLACFATRLGRFEVAMQYLNRAIERGYGDPDKIGRDADLEPLTWRADFKHLLTTLRRRTAAGRA